MNSMACKDKREVKMKLSKMPSQMKFKRFRLMDFMRLLQDGVARLTRIVGKVVSASRKQLKKNKIVFPYKKAVQLVESICEILSERLNRLPILLKSFANIMLKTRVRISEVHENGLPA
jgi:hypothetical protein